MTNLEESNFTVFAVRSCFIFWHLMIFIFFVFTWTKICFCQIDSEPFSHGASLLIFSDGFTKTNLDPSRKRILDLYNQSLSEDWNPLFKQKKKNYIRWSNQVMSAKFDKWYEFYTVAIRSILKLFYYHY